MTKKILYLLIIVMALFSSSFKTVAQDRKNEKTLKGAKAKYVVASKQDILEGGALISKSDCLACHNAENKMVGPAYKMISQTYPLNDKNIALLSQKIIAGGSGKWGEVPMPPHTSLSEADSKKMVKYILSIGK